LLALPIINVSKPCKNYSDWPGTGDIRGCFTVLHGNACHSIDFLFEFF